MTTFQAIVFAVVQGFSQILPIGADAHQVLLPYFFGWPSPDGLFSGVLALACALAIFVYFIHDWAGLISGLLKVILLRRKPMTMDERLPLYLLLASLPLMGTGAYLSTSLMEFYWTPAWVAAGMAVFGFPIWLADYFTRRNKTMTDWNWLDAIFVGIAQIFSIIPGAGTQTGGLTGALSRSYNREAAAKFSFLLAFPFLIAVGVLRIKGANFYAATEAASISNLSLGIATVVCFFSSLLALGGFMKNVTRKGFGSYVFYRIFFATATIGFFWYKSRN